MNRAQLFEYGTTVGPACACGGTIWGYCPDTREWRNGYVDARCYGCHHLVQFRTSSPVSRWTAEAIRQQHEMAVSK